jgi:hypothetical protein
MGNMTEVWSMQKFVADNFDTPNLHHVEQLLEIWADGEMGFSAVRGYQKQDATCREARSSVQHDSAADVLEQRGRARQAQEVGACIESLPPEEECAIRSIYANSTGPAVWQYGRLKDKSRDEIKQLHRSAIVRMLPWLRKRGLGFL